MRRFLVIGLAVVLLLPVMLFLLFRSGLVAPVIEREAIAAIERALPDGMNARIGGTAIVVDGFEGVAVALRDFRLTRSDSDAAVMDVGKTVVGIRTRSILAGAPQVERLSLDGVTLSLPEAGGAIPGIPPLSSINARLPALFDAVDMIVRRTSLNGTVMAIELADVSVEGTGLVIRAAQINGEGDSRTINAIAELDGREFTLSGMLRSRENGLAAMEIQAADAPLPIGRLTTMLSKVEADHLPDADRAPIATDVAFAAYETPDDEPTALTVSVTPSDLQLKLDEGDFVPVTAKFVLDWEAESDVLRLRERPLSIGQSSMKLSGAIRDAPGAGNYQFELIANEGISNPADSPEPGVRFALRTRGDWRQAERLVQVDDIDLVSSAGKAEGAGKLDFAEQIPSAVFAIAVEDFALSGVKQFWPASVARAARHWVLGNLAGGTVTKGEFLIAEPLKRRVPGTEEKIDGDTEISLSVEGVRFDVTGNIPPVRDAKGRVHFKDGEATITLDEGTTYLSKSRIAKVSDGKLVIHREDEQGIVMADLDLNVSGNADAIGELISYHPINAQSFRPYEADDLSGKVDANVTMRFALNRHRDAPPPDWDVTLDLEDAAIATPFEGRQLSGLSGTVKVDPGRADIDVTGEIDGMPAEISMVQPFGDSQTEASRDIVLALADEDRSRIAPGLDALVSGTTPVSVSGNGGTTSMAVKADLSGAELSLPWLGWSKGSGIGAETAFDLLLGPSETTISNFSLEGKTFSADGDITVNGSGLQRARFGRVKLNKNDDASVTIERSGSGYQIDVSGSSFDARSLLRHVRSQLTAKDDAGEGGIAVDMTAKMGRVTGFGGEVFKDLKLQMRHDGTDLQSLEISAMTASGFPVTVSLEGAGAKRKIRVDTLDAGETLRFVDLYGQVRGGILSASLAGQGEKSLSGTVELEDFRIFNEPRLNSLVSNGSSGQSIKDAVAREIDTSEVVFDRASVHVLNSPKGLSVSQGVVRGPAVGATFQGMVFDTSDRMRMTGTFMPAYELNSLFGDIPVLGQILGNGRDKGLIGVTFKLEGPAKKPEVTVNPLSAIAPGVFRSIFEFR